MSDHGENTFSGIKGLNQMAVGSKEEKEEGNSQKSLPRVKKIG